VILVDANLLIYAASPQSPEHAVVAPWLQEKLDSPGRVGLPWASLLAFLRIVTNPRIFASPADVDAAWSVVEDWLDRPSAWIPVPGERHREVLAALLRKTRATGNFVPDAHLAALAIEHGLIMATADAGFARFPGLRVENPLPS
jgi:uncharacterized protein